MKNKKKSPRLLIHRGGVGVIEAPISRKKVLRFPRVLEGSEDFTVVNRDTIGAFRTPIGVSKWQIRKFDPQIGTHVKQCVFDVFRIFEFWNILDLNFIVSLKVVVIFDLRLRIEFYVKNWQPSNVKKHPKMRNRIFSGLSTFLKIVQSDFSRFLEGSQVFRVEHRILRRGSCLE